MICEPSVKVSVIGKSRERLCAVTIVLGQPGDSLFHEVGGLGLITKKSYTE